MDRPVLKNDNVTPSYRAGSWLSLRDTPFDNPGIGVSCHFSMRFETSLVTVGQNFEASILDSGVHKRNPEIHHHGLLS